MFFEICLYSSLILFGFGTIYKVTGWFRNGFQNAPERASPGYRFNKAFKGLVGTLFSTKLFTLISSLILEVILQTRTLKEDRFRWTMHMLIYVGFTVLLLMHALGKILTIHLFSEYYPSINPFLFIRDFMGLAVLVGLGMATYRRIVLKKRYVRTRALDTYALALLAFILISGFLLEGIKITSHTVYEQMVEDYSATDEEKELAALESFWVEEYGVVSPNLQPPFTLETLTLGKELHEDNCAACHSPQQWAFAGYTVARLSRPVARPLDRSNASGFLWTVHILASFLGLAFLPFSKMFHIISGPVNLLVNAVMDPERSDPAAVLTRQILELDACTHCGTCSFRCSAAVAFKSLGNANILPSERMMSIKALTGRKEMTQADSRSIQEGIYLCTNCDRCTVVCPVGINLRELWFDVREFIIQKGYPEPLALSPYSFYRGLRKDAIPSGNYAEPLEAARKALTGDGEAIKQSVFELSDDQAEYREALSHTFEPSSFSYCFACENCTTVCPVAGHYEHPQDILGLLPHQIMRSVALGIEDMALSSRMLWDCVTCYQCQEHCPQGVPVTDILYELKNQATRKVADFTASSIPKSKANERRKGSL